MKSKHLAMLPLVCGCVCVPARTAESITIGFQPGVQQTTGAPVAFDLVALDLGNFMSPSLGAFDLRIDFNAAVVSLTSVSFDSFLGTPGSGEALLQSTMVGPGAVNLVGLSFLPPAALNARQPDAFALATLVFSPLALGDSPLLITVNALSNELGESFSFVKTEEGNVQFIPEPSVLFTLGAGLLALAAFLRVRGHSREEGTMKTTKIIVIALCSMSPLIANRVDADPIVASYNASLSVQTTIRGVTDEAGNPLPGLPSDLSITGRVTDVTGFNFFATLFGPTRPANIAQSSFAASGDVVVNGAPQGDGPTALGIGDGLILNSMASGTVQDFAPEEKVYVTSDVSQFGELAFVSSLSKTYLVDILVTWAFAVDVTNNTLLSSGFSLEGGYTLGLGFCCVNSTDVFFENGFIGPLGSGAAGASAGVHSFSTQFAVTPGGPNFAVRPFAGGLGATVPEPSTIGLVGVGLAVRLAWRRRRRS